MSITSWNPLNWSSEAYLVLIVVALVLRRLLPLKPTWPYRLAVETLTVGPAVLLYFLVRGLVDARVSDARRNAQHIIDLEQRLGVFWEVQMQNWIIDSSLMTSIANWIYIWCHWPVIATVILWLVLRHHDAYPRYRNALIFSGAAGMLLFAFFPVAPPRLMDGVSLVDTVTERSRSYRVFQPPSLTNPFAAMPSLHFGWNLLMGIALVEQSRNTIVRVIGVIMPIAMFLAIVFTANHYILDGLVGGTLVLLTLWAVARYSPEEKSKYLRQGSPAVSPSTAHVTAMSPPAKGPLIIAHRYGNAVSALQQAEDSGANIIEADVWLYQGRLEVRHSKTLGPLPVRWDRWSLERRNRPVLLLHELLRATGTHTTLMLDLKGRDPRLAARVIAVLDELCPGKPVLVCSQNWALLEHFRGYPTATLVHSIGNRWQLRRAWRRLPDSSYDAVSIQYRLLDDRTVARLKEHVSLVFSWPINTPGRLKQVSDWRLDGVIVDAVDLHTRTNRGDLILAAPDKTNIPGS